MYKTDIAYSNWEEKYRYGDESPLETQIRKARALASVENPTERDYWEDKFLKTLVKFDEKNDPAGLKCTMGGRITANIGTNFEKATLLNCFSGDTRYLTNKGIFSLSDTVNQTVLVPSKDGGFLEGVVNHFGKQPLNRIIFKPCIIEKVYKNKGVLSNIKDKEAKECFNYRCFGNSSYVENIKATLNHVWELVDGSITDRIQIGDIVPTCVPSFEIVEESYKKGLVHGLIFGDGSFSYKYKTNSLTKYQIRLCGSKTSFSKYFETVTTPPSLEESGDLLCYVSSEIDLKAVPETNDISYIKGFIEGYLATDGSILSKDSRQLSSTNKKALTWVKEHSIYAGYVSFDVLKDTRKKTNYGSRELYRLNLTNAKKIVWKTVDIFGGESYEDVFCLDVQKKHRFVLLNGIYTSNCYITGPVHGAKLSYTRMSDNGVVSFPVEIQTDDDPDDLTNIFLTVVEQAKTLASEGGYGINFDWIRPRSALIKGTGIEHPGVVSYMKIWDSVAECIVKGNNDGYLDKIKNHLKDDKAFKEGLKIVKRGTRKGAMMGCLSVWHPDIEEFVRAKSRDSEEKILSKFNMSVVIDNKFMEAVEANDFYELHFKGVVYKKVKARDLYNLIMESTFNNNEPGVLFVDNMMDNNPLAYLGRVNSTNPCLVGNSLLLTKSKGLQRIETLAGKKETIWNGSEWVESSIFSSGLKPVYKVTLSNGMEIIGTDDHRLCDIDSNEVTIGNSIGKRLQRSEGSDWEGIPSLLSSEMLQCLGFTFGDGNYHKASGRYKYVYIGEKDEEIESLFNHIGETLEISDRYDRRIISSRFSRHCEALEFPKVSLPERNLSERITSLPPKELQFFLKGLFSANGSVLEGKARRVTLKSTNKELIKQVQVLLVALGIKSYFTKNKKNTVSFSNGNFSCRKSYDLNITSEDLSVFSEKIGFIQKYKTDLLSKIVNLPNGRRLQPVVKSVIYVGDENVYDFTEKKTHWAFVNGLKTHNCGEISGIPSLTTVCLLGSLNLTQYIRVLPIDENIEILPVSEVGGLNTIQARTFFDWKQYEEDISIFARMLDNVNDLTYNALPSYDWATKNVRQYGMGLNGLGSALMMLGIPYNSPKAIEFVKKATETKENLTWQTSAKLAEEKGTFSAYDAKKFQSTPYFKSKRLWPETKELIIKHGVRNGKTTTNPPLGNTSVICDNVSNGIEPVFLLEYERKKIVEKWPKGLNKDNVKKVLKKQTDNGVITWRGFFEDKEYYYEPHNRGLCEVSMVRDYGYQWLLDNFPEIDHKREEYTITTDSLKTSEHIQVQQMVQYFCNQSVSKTCNLPEEYPFKEFKNLYLDAWKKGLNGFTTYRAGTMESVLSDISKNKGTKIIEKDIKLPDTFINGPTKIIKREGIKFYIHFSYLPEDTSQEFPVVIWIYTNDKEKNVSNVCNMASRKLAKLAMEKGISKEIIDETISKARVDYPHNRLGRMISLNLRHNVQRVDILTALMGIEGDNISTLLTAVRKFLAESIENGTSLVGIKCVSCGGDNVILQSGCSTCLDCGFSGCN